MYFIVMTSNVIQILCLRAQNKAKIQYNTSVINTFDIKACRKTNLDRFFGGFLNFKISKRPRLLCLRPCKDQDRGLVFIQFSSVQSPVFLPVFETGP